MALVSSPSAVRQNKIPKRNLNGILILDKPTGITSNAALQIVKRLFRAQKAGHSGSLDPIASGLLPICFGEATKFSRFLLESDKHYLLTAKLGVRTDSGDCEGKVISQRSVPALSKQAIEQALDQFRGNIQQIPSMYSALKHKGQPLYKLAREGITVERAAREITVYSFSLLSQTVSHSHPTEPVNSETLTFEVKASKGTYVRTLVDDLGEVLGCGAHVTSLRRLGAGPYTEAQMLSLPMIELLASQDNLSGLDNCLLPLDSSVSTYPNLKLSEAAAFYLRQGQPVVVPYAPTSGWVRLTLNNDRFLGVGEILDDGRVAPRRLVAIG